MRGRYKMCLTLLFVSAVFLSGCTKADNKKDEEIRSEQKTESTPSPENEEISMETVFEGQDMEGNAVSADIFSESKLTMVNVWATYCNPCLREMPGLGELAEEYDSEQFQIIGIISDVQEGADQETMDLAATLIDETGADYRHLLLNKSLYYALLTDVTAVPTTFFVDENGKILDTVVGSMDKSAWEEKINALLEKQ